MSNHTPKQIAALCAIEIAAQYTHTKDINGIAEIIEKHIAGRGSNFICEKCNRGIEIYEVGYLGSRDPDEIPPHPNMDVKCLCTGCQQREILEKELV